MKRKELYDIVWTAPMSAVAKQLGISDKSVVARCKRYSIPTPPRGFWTQGATSKTGVRPALEGDAEQLVNMVVGQAPEIRATVAAARAPIPGPSEEVPAPASGRHQPLLADLPLVRALADEMRTHEKALDLLAAVASRATALPPYEANLLLGWVSATRAELQMQDPADKLVRLLRAAA